MTNSPSLYSPQEGAANLVLPLYEYFPTDPILHDHFSEIPRHLALKPRPIFDPIRDNECSRQIQRDKTLVEGREVIIIGRFHSKLRYVKMKKLLSNFIIFLLDVRLFFPSINDTMHRTDLLAPSSNIVVLDIENST